jgi:hypothetical protein
MQAVVARLTCVTLDRVIEALGGQGAVAQLLGVHRSRISRGQAGEAPAPGHQARLDGLEFVLTRLRQGFAPATARTWLTGINAHLGNCRPIDLIARNRIAEVIAAIEQADLDSCA